MGSAIKKRLLLTIVAILLCAFSTSAQPSSKLKPKLEAGIAVGSFQVPDYPGSDEIQMRYLGMPYVVYRGDILQADREGGIRSKLLHWDDVEFDLSFGAGFPANSSDNAARSGMNDIDWIGEIGPRAKINLFKSPIVRLNLTLPIRYVFSTDFKNVNSRGWVFNPEVSFRHRALFDQNTSFNVSLGPSWATEKMHDYFYEVSPQYVKLDRPLYDASGGFFGWSAGLSISKNFVYGITAFVGMSQNHYNGAKNRTSSLMTDTVTESYFVGLAWVFYKDGLAKTEEVIPYDDAISKHR